MNQINFESDAVTEVKQEDLKNPKFDIKQINNGINIIFRGKGSDINSSNLMIDFNNKDFKSSTNISLANGLFAKSLEEEKCYVLSQEVPLNFPKNISINLGFKESDFILEVNSSMVNSLKEEKNLYSREMRRN